MVSNATHEDDQIVVSRDVTPEDTYVSNKSDPNEASSSNKSVVSKNEDQMKSSPQPNGDNVENEGDEAENLLMNICDTCGDQGWQKCLTICETCKVGAEHTYCMAVKRKKIPSGWECYDCIEDKNEEAPSREWKGKSVIYPFEISERTSSQRQPGLLKTQNYIETVGMDMDSNQDPIPDRNLDPIPDLNLDPIPDPIPNVNPDPNPGLILSLGHASSSGNLQAKKPKRPSLTPFLGQHYQHEEEEEEVDEQHRAKRPRVNTTLSLF